MTAQPTRLRTAILGADGSLPLPPDLRKQPGLEPGSEVVFGADESGRTWYRKAQDEAALKTARERIDNVRGMLAGGPSTDEILMMTRGEPPP
jgi:bifunctional DNA-binding transcriptional regulator/antitoxin component of YhaV-PrlF toxin-antitoxin module